MRTFSQFLAEKSWGLKTGNSPARYMAMSVKPAKPVIRLHDPIKKKKD